MSALGSLASAIQVRRLGNIPISKSDLLGDDLRMKFILLAAGFGTRLWPITQKLQNV